jgi:hypothetical protein
MQVDKIPAPLADDGAGNPVFLLRQGSQYLVELTVMHAKGQQLPFSFPHSVGIACDC